MGSLSVSHWILVVAILLLLFGGRGKISELMGDFAKGLRSLKSGMQDDDMVSAGAHTSSARTIDAQTPRGAGSVPGETATGVEGTLS